MGTITEIADRYTERLAALDPVQATEVGIGGHDGELTDLSPAELVHVYDTRLLLEMEASRLGAAVITQSDCERMREEWRAALPNPMPLGLMPASTGRTERECHDHQSGRQGA